MDGHDIVVIGASAGGVQALTELVKRLPADLPAAIFVVLHTPSWSPGFLRQILSHCTSLPVAHTENGEPIQTGRIYVARPDYPLLIEGGLVCLGHGPKEHYARPALDPLFRTAAETYGPRVVGIVLTGAGADGAWGCWAIKQHGDVAMVQDPAEALMPMMPDTAIRTVGADHVLPIRKLADELIRLVPDPPGSDADGASKAEALESTLMEGRTVRPVDDSSEFFRLTCPQCGSILSQLEPDGLTLFRCQIGHTFSGEELLEQQAEEVESTLRRAVRMADDQALLAERLARLYQTADEQASAASLLGRASAARRSGERIRRLLDSEGLVM